MCFDFACAQTEDSIASLSLSHEFEKGGLTRELSKELFAEQQAHSQVQQQQQVAAAGVASGPPLIQSNAGMRAYLCV